MLVRYYPRFGVWVAGFAALGEYPIEVFIHADDVLHDFLACVAGVNEDSGKGELAHILMILDHLQGQICFLLTVGGFVVDPVVEYPILTELGIDVNKRYNPNPRSDTVLLAGVLFGGGLSLGR